jgi:hypothetical protein
MIEHRAAVRERLVDQEADGLRKLNLSRDQIMARLWELANLSHEVTRGCLRFAMTPREVTGKTRGQNGVASPFLWGSFIPYNVPV